jgi:Clp amino terminal domain, pathogenicity island component
MLEGFSKDARQVVHSAQEDARARGYPCVDTEQLILGLLTERGGLGGRLLQDRGLTLERVWARAATLVPHDERGGSTEIPFTPRAKKALQRALMEALRVGRAEVDTEHILLGLLREGDGSAIRLLNELGVDLDGLRVDATARARTRSQRSKGASVVYDTSGDRRPSESPRRREPSREDSLPAEARPSKLAQSPPPRAVRKRSVASTSASEPLSDVLVTITVLNALEFAATRRQGRPLGTLDILLGILRSDTVSGWENVQVQSTFVTDEDLAEFVDLDPEAGGTWHNVPLTETATTALATAARIANEHRLLPMPPAVLTLGLLADPRSGASQALLRGASIDHSQLLSLIRDDVLDARSEHLDLDELTMTPSEPFAERAFRRACDLGGALEPSSLTLLAACVAINNDPDLGGLLDGMLLDAAALDAMRKALASREDVTARVAIERAEARSEREIGPAELIVAIALEGSPRVAEALRLRGLSSNEVAAQLSEWRLRRDGTKETSGRVLAASVSAGALSVATSALLVIELVHHGGWWKLLLLLPIWWGYPREGPLFGFLLALLIAWLASPIVGAVQAATVLAELAQAETERRTVWTHTGVRPTLREQRYLTMRLINARGLRMRSLRQSVLMTARSSGIATDVTT